MYGVRVLVFDAGVVCIIATQAKRRDGVFLKPALHGALLVDLLVIWFFLLMIPNSVVKYRGQLTAALLGDSDAFFVLVCCAIVVKFEISFLHVNLVNGLSLAFFHMTLLMRWCKVWGSHEWPSFGVHVPVRSCDRLPAPMWSRSRSPSPELPKPQLGACQPPATTTNLRLVSFIQHGFAAVRNLAFGHVAAQPIACATAQQETIVNDGCQYAPHQASKGVRLVTIIGTCSPPAADFVSPRSSVSLRKISIRGRHLHRERQRG